MVVQNLKRLLSVGFVVVVSGMRVLRECLRPSAKLTSYANDVFQKETY